MLYAFNLLETKVQSGLFLWSLVLDDSLDFDLSAGRSIPDDGCLGTAYLILRKRVTML